MLISTKGTFRPAPARTISARHATTSRARSKPACGGCGTDYIDLYQMHGFDAMTPIEEMLQTLDDLVRAGKIRYIGCSNFSGWHLMKSLAVSERLRPRPLRGTSGLLFARRPRVRVGADAAGAGPEGRHRRVEPARVGTADRQGPPRPAAAGDEPRAEQAGRRPRPAGRSRALYRVVDALDEVARETGKTVPQVALNWLLQRPSVANVIIGARNEEQLRQNIGAVGWTLTAAQMEKLDEASAVTPVYPYWHQRGFTERNPPPV